MRSAPRVPVDELAWQVTCAAARAGPVGDHARLAAACRRGPAWDHVIALARWHRVEPLMHRNLAVLPADVVPPAVREEFARAFARTAARNLRSSSACQMILGRLEDAGLEPVTFKGPTLALRAYGSLALRPFEDVDVIVANDAIERAIDVLAAAGYRPAADLTTARVHSTFAAGRALPFVAPGGVLSLDLHAFLVPRYLPLRTDRRSLDPYLQRIELLGRKVLTPTPEMLMLTLCVHGAKHFWERLYWVCDVAALAAIEGLIDWPRLWAMAEQWRLGRLLRVGLCLSHRVLDAGIPTVAMARVEEDRVAVALATEVEQWLPTNAGRGLPGLQAAWFQLRAIEGATARTMFCRQVLQPAAGDWESWRLPAALGFLYYPARLGRLLMRGVARAQRPTSPPS